MVAGVKNLTNVVFQAPGGNSSNAILCLNHLRRFHEFKPDEGRSIQFTKSRLKIADNPALP